MNHPKIESRYRVFRKKSAGSTRLREDLPWNLGRLAVSRLIMVASNPGQVAWVFIWQRVEPISRLGTRRPLSRSSGVDKCQMENR